MAGLSTGSGLVQASSISGAYVRPSDWPPLPTPPLNAISILTAVFPTSVNSISLKITVVGGYTVDWGDGTVNNWASGVQAEHTYNYVTLNTSVTSRNYKTSIIQISTQTPGSGITAFDFGTKSSTFSTFSAGSQQWLDITVNTPSATGILFSNGTQRSSFLEQTTILSVGNATTLNSAWIQCFRLQSCVLPTNFGSTATTISNTWNRCESLVNITLPSGFGAAVLDANSMFSGCMSLRNIIFPAGFGTLATNFSNLFAACPALYSVSFPSGCGAACTTLDSTFFQCDSLTSVVLPAGFGPGVTTLNNTFNGCISIENILFPTGFAASLAIITTAFSSCPNLESIIGLVSPITFSVGGCKLSASALNAIYTALPTVTLQTLTASTNYGYAASTPTIATAKGWTVN